MPKFMNSKKLLTLMIKELNNMSWIHIVDRQCFKFMYGVVFRSNMDTYVSSKYDILRERV